MNSAWGILFQFPSLPRHMRELQEREKRDNAQSLFDAKGMPGDSRMRNIADGILSRGGGRRAGKTRRRESAACGGTDNNAAYLAECGLARRKIENERNSVLKNLGYNLEHNFGQGSSRAADAFFLLNLLALQFHTILGYCGLEYQLTHDIPREGGVF